jgi:hypothetical protein
MNIFIIFCIGLFSLGLLLIFLVIFFSVLKHFQRTRFQESWKFLDYVSVGYIEHLYKKYIKRS